MGLRLRSEAFIPLFRRVWKRCFSMDEALVGVALPFLIHIRPYTLAVALRWRDSLMIMGRYLQSLCDIRHNNISGWSLLHSFPFLHKSRIRPRDPLSCALSLSIGQDLLVHHGPSTPFLDFLKSSMAFFHPSMTYPPLFILTRLARSVHSSTA